ncbi:hypothetical protein PF006_g1818 [Phytophthora fragariae]|uniref:Uncharacterized protein n=1 Tax=Phytophthora fragariae TaxID=53985 RepID=A0A6A3UUW4_9STRA|nr:hypothetical protein PF006_g1818 [Phytophthora fragariae]KAE9249934.1 hypothetical protein PF004_g3163 [Phytophthora fragariae]
MADPELSALRRSERSVNSDANSSAASSRSKWGWRSSPNFYLYTMTLASVESSDEASGGSFARGRECVDAVESVAVVLDTSVFRVHVERKLVGDAELKKGSPMDVS